MNEGVDGESVPAVLQAHAGLEIIKKDFKDEPFVQQNLVQNGHQVVLHVAANAGDQVEVLLPEALQQRMGKIALISKDLPLQCSGQDLKWFAVVTASIGDPEGHDLRWPFWLLCRWSLKPKNQAMVLQPRFANPLEDHVVFDPGVMADGQLGTVGKDDAGFIPEEICSRRQNGRSRRSMGLTNRP